MLHSVTKKQNNSRMCFVCGLSNDHSLRAAFYETDAGGELVAKITASSMDGRDWFLHREAGDPERIEVPGR